MMRSVIRHRFAALLVTALLLAACGGEDGTPSTIQTTAAPQSAAVALNLFLNPGSGTAGNRPGSVLSVYISMYLAHGPGTYTAATRGAQIQAGLQEPVASTDEVYLVLQQLGAALQVNVPDLLNRSSTRRQTLDEYVKTLTNLTIESQRQVTLLEQREEILKDRRSEERDVATTIQRDLNRALRDKDYSTAARKQQELQPAESTLRATEVEQDEVENILEIYEDLLELAAQRLDAIAKNREILIAGQQVVEVPGIDDLNILQRSRRGRLGL